MRALLALICVLAIATSAYAECAWVLWAAHSDGSWTVIGSNGGADAEKVCKQYVDKRRAEVEAEGTGQNLVCLPDTIDPRGPKAK